MSTLSRILRNPPTKQVPCHRCGGCGYINPTGMICSDPCPDCKAYNDGVSSNTGKAPAIDYRKWCAQVRAAVRER